MNMCVEEAIKWITENFPALAVSDTEAEQIQKLAIRRALFLKPFILELYRVSTAIERVESCIKTAGALHLCPTLGEVLEELRGDDGARFFAQSLDSKFVADLRQIVADGWSAYQDTPRGNEVDHLLVIFQFYTRVLPRMRSISQSFILRVGLAEAQLIHLHTTVIERLFTQHEAWGASLSHKILGARNQDKAFAPMRDKIIRVFTRMSEEHRQKFFTRGQRHTFFKKFREQAAKLNVQWSESKNGKSPANNTIQRSIDRYLQSKVDIDIQK